MAVRGELGHKKSEKTGPRVKQRRRPAAVLIEAGDVHDDGRLEDGVVGGRELAGLSLMLCSGLSVGLVLGTRGMPMSWDRVL